MITFLKTVAAIFVMTLIIPLMVAGGAGSWKAGLQAWLSYLKIMGMIVAVGGGFGLLMIGADFLNR